MTIILAIFLAGFFTGTTTVLIYLVTREQLFTRKFDAERMKWANKAVIREGSQPLFSAEDINGEGADNVSPAPDPKPPRQFSNPFRRKRNEMRENLAKQTDIEAGRHLPEGLKYKITQAAEEAKANVAE